MASGNMKDIKRRVKSVESTMQITKAMELVASSKLRKAKLRAEDARPFFDAQYSLMCRIAGETENLSTVYTRHREVKNRLFIVIAGDRGLAGGYNSNILKLVQQTHGDEYMPKIIAVGKKSAEFFTKHEYDVVAQFPGIAEHERHRLDEALKIALDTACFQLVPERQHECRDAPCGYYGKV